MLCQKHIEHYNAKAHAEQQQAESNASLEAETAFGAGLENAEMLVFRERHGFALAPVHQAVGKGGQPAKEAAISSPSKIL